MTRTTFDLVPLHRYTVGFDQLLNEMDRMVNAQQANNSYPPYNIVRMDDDSFMIEIAVAGFKEEDLEVSVDQSQLIIQGSTRENDDRTYLHKGIGMRNFTRTFRLEHYIEVTKAKIENGLLRITLTRIIPDELKPRKIAIDS